MSFYSISLLKITFFECIAFHFLMRINFSKYQLKEILGEEFTTDSIGIRNDVCQKINRVLRNRKASLNTNKRALKKDPYIAVNAEQFSV